MTLAHLVNLAVHISAGSFAIMLGAFILSREKGTAQHRRLGRRFAALVMTVCTSAAIGSALFRFFPIFAVLALLVGYQLLGALRDLKTREAGPAAVDAMLTLAAMAIGCALIPHVLAATPARHSAPTMVIASLGALACLLAWDAARWIFPRHWHAILWRYEHAYKMIASLFAMVSAFSGNVLRFAQPWSHVLPTVIAFILIGRSFRRIYQQQRTGRASVAAQAWELG
jgi:uncharacterized membrane protein